MKNTIKLFGVIALVAVIGFSMAGCKEDETDPKPQTVTYTGTADGVTYTLKITENTARYTAQSGDSYELTVGTKKSTGTVQSVTGGTLTLQPSREGAATFTATVSSSGITAMNGTIAFDVGDSQEAPTTVTPIPPNNGNNAGKTIIITGYPGSMEAGDVHFTSIVPVGTDFTILGNSVVAAAWYPDNGVSISNNTATIRLKASEDPDVDDAIWTDWTGSGTFDVWIAPKGTQTGNSFYKAGSVSITGATTTIEASRFSFIQKLQ